VAAAKPPSRQAAKPALTLAAAAWQRGNVATWRRGNVGLAGLVMPAMSRPLLTKRALFYYQLRAEPQPGASAQLPEVAFVLSGANFADKLSQVLAFVYGAQASFEYHSQKGKCADDARFEAGPTLICNKRWDKRAGERRQNSTQALATNT
jgi:hypothetical protein